MSPNTQAMLPVLSKHAVFSIEQQPLLDHFAHKQVMASRVLHVVPAEKRLDRLWPMPYRATETPEVHATWQVVLKQYLSVMVAAPEA